MKVEASLASHAQLHEYTYTVALISRIFWNRITVASFVAMRSCDFGLVVFDTHSPSPTGNQRSPRDHTGRNFAVGLKKPLLGGYMAPENAHSFVR